MVEATLRMVDPNVPFTAVRAARGKVARAEPVAALYEQGRVHHLGALPLLEDQMCAFTGDFDRAAAGYSPDRVDALVWAFTELLVEPLRRRRDFRGVSPPRRKGGRGAMTLLVKDANTTVQSLSTEVDGNGNLVPLHAPASVMRKASRRRSGRKTRCR